MNDSFQALLEDLIGYWETDGTLARWEREKAGRQRKPCRYDRAAVMRSAWAYRRAEGLTMSEALKRAWADARRANLRIAA
ncbi:MAG: hypothetical protein LBB72_01550 [Spirochaetaceae bacterium]|jgi:hypothetical protein|nr:hypothetical protein [Spirochaetaceae bacterium]